MLAIRVSPPYGGTMMLRRVLACGGFSTKVTSVCQWLTRPSSLSTGRTFGSPSTAGTVGCAEVSGPK